MEVKIKSNNELVEATIEMVDGMMIVSPISLKEKFEPKDGDVVTNILHGTYQGTGIFHYEEQTEVWIHACINKSGKINYDGYLGYVDDLRPATKEEKKKLFDKLAEEGWEWKADTKELVKLKWKPKLHEKYYHPTLRAPNGNLLFESTSEICKDEIFDNILIKNKWAFKTKEECQSFCDKLNQAISQVKP